MPVQDKISVEVVVDKDIDSVWEAFTVPDCIVRWNFASDDWCCPRAKNGLQGEVYS